jgi:hypothetical protein
MNYYRCVLNGPREYVPRTIVKVADSTAEAWELAQAHAVGCHPEATVQSVEYAGQTGPEIVTSDDE